MDAIDTFLDAMFAPYPATPRLMEAKAELRTMMEDAYGDAIASGKTHNEAVGKVITDFGNLEELAPILGIETELRPADAAGGQDTAPGAAEPTLAAASGPTPTLSPAPGSYPPVTLPEAQALAEARRTTSRLLGAGVALIVASGTPFMIAFALSDSSQGPIGSSSSTLATTGSVIALCLGLALVATGVGLLIRRGRAFVGLGHLTDGHFTRNPQTAAWATRLRTDHEGPRSRALAIAVGLWIAAGAPLLAGGLFDMSDNATTLGVAAAAALVALGLYIFLPTNWAASTYSTLTEEGHALPGTYEYEDERNDRIIGTFAAVYWPIAAVVYLLWGFIFNAWGHSWVLWPIGGALFVGIAAVLHARTSARRTKAEAQR
ncbi:permease prefix domain 1-containing protein [Actinomyces slackii]|uniref:Uncharacterized protein n=1 Tax=Actinomyces slackii TaxID=52774 RepID=A0A3S4U1P1_9ACTO|nr:permease prefix domain 1-containing protein [Actinomyces slackii]VEG74284.1 Uncharacterised protein [Actinomyces slackii]